MGGRSVIFGIIPIIDFTLNKSRGVPASLTSLLRDYRFFTTEGDLLLFDGSISTALTNRSLSTWPQEKSVRALLLGHKCSAPPAPGAPRIRLDS